jgi:hypothetical protein
MLSQTHSYTAGSIHTEATAEAVVRKLALPKLVAPVTLPLNVSRSTATNSRFATDADSRNAQRRKSQSQRRCGSPIGIPLGSLRWSG